MIANLLYKIDCILGEGPVWHPWRNSLFWVDIEGRSIFELDWKNRDLKKWEIGHRVSLIIPVTETRLVLAVQGGIGDFDLKSQEWSWIIGIEKNLPSNRCNDGACDSKGRLWIGTMALNFEPGAGSLYCVEKGLPLRKALGQVSISNGLVWSLDNKRAYYIDSPTQSVCSYLFDVDNGSLSFEKIAIKVPGAMGTPDGMCMDEEGMLWVAHWGGFGVNRWNPYTGECLDKIVINAPNASSCTFAGDHLDDLVITTARQQLTPEELEKYPDSGSLFMAKLNVRGIANHPCGL